MGGRLRGRDQEGGRDGKERERGVTGRGEKEERGRGEVGIQRSGVTSKFAIKGLVVPLIF